VSLEDRLSCYDQRHGQILGHIQLVQLESVKNAQVGHKWSYVDVVHCLSVVRVNLLSHDHLQL